MGDISSLVSISFGRVVGLVSLIVPLNHLKFTSNLSRNRNSKLRNLDTFDISGFVDLVEKLLELLGESLGLRLLGKLFVLGMKSDSLRRVSDGHHLFSECVGSRSLAKSLNFHGGLFPLRSSSHQLLLVGGDLVGGFVNDGLGLFNGVHDLLLHIRRSCGS